MFVDATTWRRNFRNARRQTTPAHHNFGTSWWIEKAFLRVDARESSPRWQTLAYIAPNKLRQSYRRQRSGLGAQNARAKTHGFEAVG